MFGANVHAGLLPLAQVAQKFIAWQEQNVADSANFLSTNVVFTIPSESNGENEFFSGFQVSGMVRGDESLVKFWGRKNIWLLN
jgi:hypothetical protein